jgi:hypothetical protein
LIVLEGFWSVATKIAVWLRVMAAGVLLAAGFLVNPAAILCVIIFFLKSSSSHRYAKRWLLYPT